MRYFYDRNQVLIRTAAHWDIPQVKDKLRTSDVFEVMASHGHTPHQALSYSFNSTPVCFTVIYKNEPVAMFGVTASPEGNGTATVWLLATNGIYAMRWTFLKLSRLFIHYFLNQFPKLYNLVDARNKDTVRWLEWCGAKFGPPMPYGEAGLMFRPFVIERKEELKLVHSS